MNRRRFLALFGAAAAVAVADPERLLWTPGATTHVLPPASGWRPLTLHEQYCQGQMSRTSGFDWFEQAIPINRPPEPWPWEKGALDAAAKSIADRIDAEGLRLYYKAFDAKLHADMGFYRGDQWPSVREVIRPQREYNALQSRYLENMTRSIKATERVVEDLLPAIYVTRIMPDGRERK